MNLAAKIGLSRVMVRLIGGHVGLHTAMAGMRMALPLLALRMGYGTATAGILMALCAVGQIAVALPAARLVERCTLKSILIGCALVASVGISLAALWPHLAVLCVSALASGCAMGVSLITMQRHVSSAAHGEQQLRQAFSWISVAPSISVFIGTLAAGVMIDQSGFQGAFVMLALLPLATLGAAFLATEQPIALAGDGQRKIQASLWRNAPFRRLLMLNALMTASWDLHAFMVPVIAHERGMSASAIGTLLSAFALAATLSRLALPVVVQRVREWTMIAGALAMAAALFAVYPFLPSHLLMLACSFMQGVLLGGVQPTVMILIHHITPPQRHGDAMATRFIMINASAISMPMLYGAAGGFVSVSGVFLAAAGVVGLGAALGFWSERNHSADGPD